MVGVYSSLLLFQCTIAYYAITAYSAGSRQRWYYTGKFNFDKAAEENYEGGILDLFSLYNHQEEEKTYVYAGGLIVTSFNATQSKENSTFTLDHNDIAFLQHIVGASNIHVKSTASYKIFLNPNYHRVSRFNATEVLQAEIGLFDHDKEVYLETHFDTLSIGTLHASLVLTPSTHPSTKNTLHRIMWTWDSFGRSSILHHTWHTTSLLAVSSSLNEEISKEATISADSAATVSVPNEVCRAKELAEDAKGRNLRVMTYNLWHNNPPSWVYHDKRRRWERYERRIRHFAERIVLEDPDLIAIQEVRLDSAFYHPKKTQQYWHQNSRNTSKLDSGSQIEHLMQAITIQQQLLLTEDERNHRVPYQLLYHPSMLQAGERLNFRNEEGLLLLSKYPIVAAEALFLPREVGNKDDDHQRVALIMQVNVQELSACSDSINEEEQIVTLVTSHFSLYSPSRERGVQAIRRHLNRIDHTSNVYAVVENNGSDVVFENLQSGSVEESKEKVTVRPSMAEILLGDFNAEPHEQTIQYLLHPLSPVPTSDTVTNPDDNNEVPFVDVWSLKNPVTEKKSKDEISDDDLIKELGYTFPACNPIKRIDFILLRCPAAQAAIAARARTGQADGIMPSVWNVVVDDVYVTGQNPTIDTEHLVGSRPDLGMNDLDSPLWASDHFAVIADLRLEVLGKAPVPSIPHPNSTKASTEQSDSEL